MKRLRLQFGLFFLLLIGGLAALILFSLRQIDREEEALWQGVAEQVFDQFQSQLSDFLTMEDQRPMDHYQFSKGVQDPTSPLAKIPVEGTQGIIGYFQIDPDNAFRTPYLPRTAQSVDKRVARQKLHDHLGGLTQKLRLEAAPSIMLRAPRPRPVASATQAQEQVYPNPIQQKRAKLEKKKSRFASNFSRAKLGASMDAAPEMEEAAEPMEDLAGAAAPVQKRVLPKRLMPVQVRDPFQAQLVRSDTLVFFRRLWRDKKMYVQGFAVDIRPFFEWLMGPSFANTELPTFAISTLMMGDEVLAQYGQEEITADQTQLLFSRPLGFPLDFLQWEVRALMLPHIGGRWWLYLLSLLLLGLSTLGLYLMYRSVATQVQLSQKRQDFVSAVTHELKTPLTSIRMYSEMLSDNWAKDETKRREYYGHINKESSRLSRLIENVLQLARLEKGNYRINTQTASPNADFEEIGQELTKLVTSQGFHLTTRTAPDLPPIAYDPEALKQVLLILCDNSLKFAINGENKELEMSLERSDNTLVWSWRDHGPGIPDKDMKKVFEKFYRAENELTRSTKGTGIGLAMAHMIITAMGAQIELANHPEGGLAIRLSFSLD